MSRTYPGGYAERAFLRFVAKREREAKNAKGGGCGGHPPKQPNQHQHSQHSDSENCRQLTDANWFANHPRARSRVRDAFACEDEIAAGMKVLVMLRGHRTFQKYLITGGIT